MKFDTYNEQYAYIETHASHGYGHIDAIIYNAMNDEYASVKPRIKVTCQCGSWYPDGDAHTYGWQWGVDSFFDLMRPCHLERAAKVTRRIEKKLDKMQDELGRAATFAEFCARVLIASGIDAIFVNTNSNGSYSGEVYDLPRYGIKGVQAGRLREILAQMESDLIARHYPKAA